MQVTNHRLYADAGTAVRFVSSPNQGDGFSPRFLLVHYTAAPTLPGTVAWFQNPLTQVSSHLIVDRDGDVVQMVPLNRRAWHAGVSRWGAFENLNAHAIGLELVNAGALERTGTGGWVDWARHAIPDRDVIVARHKHEAIVRGWHAFTETQIARALDVALALNAEYGFTAILGHDDVAPGRKIDPGPAFPMERFERLVRGTDGRRSSCVMPGIRGT